jgi:RNA polymerase sigma-70 factor (sigma-E family)
LVVVAPASDAILEFADYVAARSPSLLRSAYLLTGDAGLAEDLLQVAWSKVWPRWTRLVRTGDPEAYMRRVVYTTYVSWWRRRWVREEPVADLPDADGAEGGQTDAAYRLDVLRALATLPRGQRAVIILRFFDDQTEARTAATLGCTVGTVKSQTARALARLRLHPLFAERAERGERSR